MMRLPELRTVRVDQIEVEKNVARLDGELGSVEELANVIDSVGWIDPLILKVKYPCPTHQNNPGAGDIDIQCLCAFVIIGGHRRFAALALVNKKHRDRITEVQAQVYPRDVSRAELAYVAVLENAHRENPSVYQKILALRALRFEYGQSVAQISTALRMAYDYTEKLIRVPERLHPAILADLRRGMKKLTVPKLFDLSVLPHDRQWEAWQAELELGVGVPHEKNREIRLRRRYEVERELKRAKRHKNEEVVRVLEWALKMREEI